MVTVEWWVGNGLREDTWRVMLIATMSNEAEHQAWKTLNERLESLYGVFARFTQTEPITCEMGGGVTVPMGIALRDRTAGNLVRYHDKAVTTWGTIEDFKHFLPRLLELAIQRHRRVVMEYREMTGDELIGPSIELDMINMKLQYTGAAKWPAAESNALRVFAWALHQWEQTLPVHYATGSLGEEMLRVTGATP